jgi:DNA-binding transcriptional regulator YiaG
MSIAQQFPFDSTTASVPLPSLNGAAPLMVGLMLGLGTSSYLGVPAEIAILSPRVSGQTTSSMMTPVSPSAGPAIAELRRLSGLTWEQLSRLFKVSRRSLHFWASGKAMTPANEEHLQRLLAVMRGCNRGSAGANRTALLTAHAGGDIPFDLLENAEYELAAALLGASGARERRAPRPTADLVAARAPRPPEQLVGALQDRPYPASGRFVAGKAVPLPKRG